MGIRDRLRRLEDATPGDCPRCSGVSSITVCDSLERATKNGEPMTEEEWHAYKAEEREEGRCPVCGREPIMIVVGYEGSPPA